MRTLVTGGAGFMGSNHARHALTVEHELVSIDDLCSGSRVTLGTTSSPSRHRLWMRWVAPAGLDAVEHLSALSSHEHREPQRGPRGLRDRNAPGRRGGSCCKRPCQVVAPSSSVYGLKSPAMPKSGREWMRAMSPYAVSKRPRNSTHSPSSRSSLRRPPSSSSMSKVPRRMPGHAYAAVILAHLLKESAYLSTVVIAAQATPTPQRLAKPSSALLSGEPSIPNRPTWVSGPTKRSLTSSSTLSGCRGASLACSTVSLESVTCLFAQADNGSANKLFPDVRPVRLEDGLARHSGLLLHALPSSRKAGVQ